MADIIKDEYYLALGKFIQAYSETETCLHMTFNHFAKLEPEIGNLIKKDHQASKVSSHIRDLVALNKFSPAVIADVEACLDHFGAISEFRHNIVHRGARLSEDGRCRSTNYATMKSLEALEVSMFTPADLTRAAFDLRCISLRLFDCADETKDSRPAHEGAVLYASWRYTPVVPDRPHQPPPKEKRESKRQRKASQKKLAGRTRPPRR